MARFVRVATESRAMVEARRARVIADRDGGVSIEYGLLGLFLGTLLLAAITGMKTNLNANNARIATAVYSATVPTPPWTSSTLTGTQSSTLLGYPATRQIYKNSDGSTRYVDTINDPKQAAAAVYASTDTAFDANGNLLFQSYTVNKGDYGTPAPVVNSNYVYTGPNSFSYVETSADPNGWLWSSHKDTVSNGNLVSQLVYNKDGSVYQTNFGLSPSGVNRLTSVNSFNADGTIAYTTNYNYDASGNMVGTSRS